MDAHVPSRPRLPRTVFVVVVTALIAAPTAVWA